MELSIFGIKKISIDVSFLAFQKSIKGVVFEGM